ncbi:MAG: hypothetical protein AAGN82_16155 [Myxococcota bacterium]
MVRTDLDRGRRFRRRIAMPVGTGNAPSVVRAYATEAVRDRNFFGHDDAHLDTMRAARIAPTRFGACDHRLTARPIEELRQKVWP